MVSLAELPAVEVVEGCDPANIPEHVTASDVPVLLKGLVADWPAVKACNESLPGAAQYMSQFWTNELVTCLLYTSDAADD